MSAPGPTRRAASTNAEWETPPDFFAWRSLLYRHQLDVCAHAGNALASNFIGPGSLIGEDALDSNIQWNAYCDSAFTNPPYGNLMLWCRTYELHARRDRVWVEALIPANTATRWFAFCEETAAHIEILGPGRIPFWHLGKPLTAHIGEDGKPRRDNNTTDSMLVRWQPGGAPAGSATIKLVDWRAEMQRLGWKQ